MLKLSEEFSIPAWHVGAFMAKKSSHQSTKPLNHYITLKNSFKVIVV
jgi:hypothetical protein